MLHAIKEIGRNGREIFKCPLCGHIFVNSKKYSKHLMKSHLRNVTMNKRKWKKFMKQLLLINIKEKSNIELTNYEKYLKIKAKMNNISLDSE
jgi:uncharacterized C2H2 Zn-finger protein